MSSSLHNFKNPYVIKYANHNHRISRKVNGLATIKVATHTQFSYSRFSQVFSNFPWYFLANS